MKDFSSYFPIIKWAGSYNKDWLRPDIIAGITLGAFTIPEVIAFVSLANLPPEVGLYSAMIALMVHVIFGSSRQLSVGPTSTISILWFHIRFFIYCKCCPIFYDNFTYSCNSRYISNISWTLRLGFIIKFILKTGLTGFLAGIALFIVSGQLPKLFGITGVTGNFFERIYYLFIHIDQTNPYTLAIGLGGILFLYMATKKFPKLPNTLFLVLGSILLISLSNLASLGVHLVGSIPQDFQV